MSNEITSLNLTLEELDQLKTRLESLNKTSLADLNQSLSALSGSIGSLGNESTQIFASMVAGISSFYTAMMANPFVALTTLIGSLAVAVITTSDNMSELSETEKENVDVAQEVINKYQEMIDKQTELNESFSNRADLINGEYAVAKKYLDELYKMMENGEPIENLETAKFYIGELNRMGIEGISITDQKIVKLGKEKEAYEEQLEQLRIKAMLQAHEEEYGQALLNHEILTGRLTVAKSELNSEEEKNSILLSEYINKNSNYYDAINACATANGQFSEKLAIAKNELGLVRESLVKNEEALNTQEALIALQSGSLQKQAIANIDLALSYDEVVGASEQMTYKWIDLQNQLSIFDEQMKAHENGTKTMSQTEIEQNGYSRDYIIKCMAEKGVAMSMTYDEMTLKLGESYSNMSQVEKDNLKGQYNNLVSKGNDKSVELIRQKNTLLQILESQGIEANSELAKQHMAELVLWQSQGSNCGREYINKINVSMNEGKPQMQKTGADLNNSATFGFEKKSAVLRVDTTNANKKISDAAKNAEFNKTANVGVKYTSKFAGIIIGGIEIPIKFSMCANGGFPETGELFVAREAGPELVGRINGKTAVANNDQIVSGISNGVFNAVRSAMAGNGSSGNMNIHATFVMDGEVVGKQVIKYHNGVVRRTGTTPLMI